MSIKVIDRIEIPVKPSSWLVIHLPVARREGFYKVLEIVSEKYDYKVVETPLAGDMLRFNVVSPGVNAPEAYFHLGATAGQFWANELTELKK